jgi:GNAT superfamily N-acetyltransferase
MDTRSMCEICEQLGLAYHAPAQGARLRALTPQDAEEAAAVIRKAFAAQDYNTDPPSSALKETTRSVAAHLAVEGGLAMQCDGGIVALVLTERRPDCLYVRRLCVLPEFRATGAGARLVNACEEEARLLGFSELEVHVRVGLAGNRAFFAKLGFVETGIGRHEGFDEVTFVIARKRVAAVTE